MSRYDQRKRKLLQDPEVMAGYQEMAAEFQLMQAIEAIRARQQVSKECLAAAVGKKRESVSRVLTAEDVNPRLSTVLELLSALQITADITLRRAKEGEPPLKVITEPELMVLGKSEC